MSFPIWKAFFAGGGLFFLLVGVSSAEEYEGWEAWEAPEEPLVQESKHSEYSDLGVGSEPTLPEESRALDPFLSVPGALLNEGRPPTADEEASLKGTTLEPTSATKPTDLEQAWKKKGYDRPAGAEEKEKRPDAIFGSSDPLGEIRNIREGSY